VFKQIMMMNIEVRSKSIVEAMASGLRKLCPKFRSIMA